MTDTDCAWAAGFIDADGCISISKTKRRGVEYDAVAVVVVQKDPMPLLRLQEIFGDQENITTVRHSSTGRTYFKLAIHGKRAEFVLSCVLPYLTLKRAKAVVALELLRAKAERSWGEKSSLHAERLSESAPTQSGDAIVRAVAN